MKAILLLEDGKFFEGKAFGASGETMGEVVFHTGMTGYQEILTDPSYNEQIVTMTYPQIGNYGVNKEDAESRALFLKGFIVKENCSVPSNWRSQMSLDAYLKKNNVIGLEKIDTRELVRHIRDHGAKGGIISTKDFDKKSLIKKLSKYKGLVGRDIVKGITTKKKYAWTEGIVYPKREEKIADKYKVITLDFGVKQNILRMLRTANCSVSVVPANTTAESILKQKPDGVFLSNGPGDPEAVSYAIETVKQLLGKVPMFGICLGHQILSLALGCKTYKLKFGHHGANHPVMNLKTKTVEITSQNHGFCVDVKSLPKDVIATHTNLNDMTNEGIMHKTLPAFSVQYHPEASPGPHDSSYLFKEFTDMIDNF